jgi:hypothetical protein
MDNTLHWFERMDQKRIREGRTVRGLIEHIGVKSLNHNSYYRYRSDPKAYPKDPIERKAIADYLNEDVAALETEMRTGAPAPPTSFLETAGRAEIGVRLYQEHVRALASVLGMTSIDRELGHSSRRRKPSEGATGSASAPTPRYSGVDVVARLLRERLPCGENPVDVSVVVRPTARGRAGRFGTSLSRDKDWEPFQYQIYVIPDRIASGDSAPGEPARLLERTRKKVDKALSGILLPVTREHSDELFLKMFVGRADLLLYPGFLDMRAPMAGDQPKIAGGDTVVVGVFYTGVPDVAAWLARRLGYGFANFDQLARLQVRAGLRGLPDHRLKVATEQTALSVLRGTAPAEGNMVWASDDPEALLGGQTGEALRHYPGRLVFLRLSERALNYAAYRICCVDSTCPDQNALDEWRARLHGQQEQLSGLVAARALVRTVDLPGHVQRRSDGSYPDAVHDMFDHYLAAASRLYAELADV